MGVRGFGWTAWAGLPNILVWWSFGKRVEPLGKRATNEGRRLSQSVVVILVLQCFVFGWLIINYCRSNFFI